MRDFVIHDASGKIVQVCSSTTMTFLEIMMHWPVPEGHAIAFLEGPITNPDDWLIVDGALVERQVIAPVFSKTSIEADGEDACVITDLPDPCSVKIQGALTHGPVDVTGGTLTLTSTTPGILDLTFTWEPTHKPWKGSINAT